MSCRPIRRFARANVNDLQEVAAFPNHGEHMTLELGTPFTVRQLASTDER